ncbi:hypothetical protein GEV33_011466 [Tenebrio molitor]|uniref:Uncharacterized protein n=1 Tax=Tenebrio molitor TaxID=7067 RepID=A0A8J6L826_TENMO|nr:hypothetical protein GEV33_011466 [Tenebrio molitor]
MEPLVVFEVFAVTDFHGDSFCPRLLGVAARHRKLDGSSFWEYGRWDRSNRVRPELIKTSTHGIPAREAESSLQLPWFVKSSLSTREKSNPQARTRPSFRGCDRWERCVRFLSTEDDLRQLPAPDEDREQSTSNCPHKETHSPRNRDRSSTIGIVDFGDFIHCANLTVGLAPGSGVTGGSAAGGTISQYSRSKPDQIRSFSRIDIKEKHIKGLGISAVVELFSKKKFQRTGKSVTPVHLKPVRKWRKWRWRCFKNGRKSRRLQRPGFQTGM